MSGRVVWLQCGAVGIDIGQGWGLYVSAQDNDLAADLIRTRTRIMAHQTELPLPTPEEVSAARAVIRAVGQYLPEPTPEVVWR